MRIKRAPSAYDDPQIAALGRITEAMRTNGNQNTASVQVEDTVAISGIGRVMTPGEFYDEQRRAQISVVPDAPVEQPAITSAIYDYANEEPIATVTPITAASAASTESSPIELDQRGVPVNPTSVVGHIIEFA